MKKLIAILMTVVLVIGLAGCAGGSGSGSSNSPGGSSAAPAVTIKVWASQEDQVLTRELADKFIEANPQYNVTFELGVVGEPEAFQKYGEDPAAAADVFFFPNDQLHNFVNAGGLSEITRNKSNIVSRNGDGPISAATVDGRLYGYPATADNGYFLYYDKSVLNENDVKTLDGLLSAASAAGKRILMDLDGNGWYVASFFIGAGGTLALSPEGKQIIDWNNAKGLGAATAMQAFTAHPAYMNGDDNVLKGGIGGTIAAGVSGTWNANDIEAKLGDNYAATKLPTFTMDGKQVQMGSFGGYKLVGVNSMISDADKLVVAFDFADFLTNEESQIRRFEARSMGPSNIKAASNAAVLENVALAALAAQSPYAVSQNDVNNDTFWTPAGAFGTAMVNGVTTDLQTLLDNMVAQIQS